MLRTPLCDLLGIEYPIIQGAMGNISTGKLAGAVSKAGGLGIIHGATVDGDYIREQINIVRSITDKPFGVNLIMQNRNIERIVQACVDEKVPVVTSGAGTPAPFMPALTEAGIKVIPVIPHVRAATKMQAAGATAVVAEGMESGGHIGKMATMPLVPQVVDAIDIPVIAAGGIADGRGLMAALMLGAVGIQMGTVFITSEECEIAPVYKQKILEAIDTRTEIIGHPKIQQMRALKSPYTETYFKRVEANEDPQVIWETLEKGSCRRAINGDAETGAFEAGQISGMIKKIRPVEEIIQDVMAQAEEVYRSMQNYWK